MSHRFVDSVIALSMYRPKAARLPQRTLATIALVLLPLTALAQIPPGYYDTVDATNATTLRTTLHPVIDDHTRFPYTSTATDTWNILELADEDPNDSTRILDIYKNASYQKFGAGNSFYDREHTWPSSYGFPNDNSTNYPYTDCHMLHLADGGYNGSRSNKPYRYCNAACSENPTDVNNGRGGGTGVYPGNSNWTTGAFTAGTWETWIGQRGDVARALLYMDIRYEGGTHGVTGAAEPDLILTDTEALIDASNTGVNESVAYMGMLSVLLQWHLEDPVDALEIARNDTVHSFQGNRNPFIDHPEWVACLFQNSCSGAAAPAPPTGLTAAGGDGFVDLNWNDNTEPDLSGYNVYRATVSGGPYTKINGTLVAASLYTDSTVTNGTTYYYVVTAVDTSALESGSSNQASATPNGAAPGTPWINEIHYDNDGTDTDEGVEVAGPAGTSLTGWQLVGYNGNGNVVYSTTNLSGTIPNQQNGFGTLWFAIVGLQNGSPDGVALVNGATVVQFLSYEGVITAADGPAAGLTSTDIIVAETATTPVGQSLQLTGTGEQYTDFTWAAPATHTRGLPNNGQTMLPGCSLPADCDDGLFCNGTEACVSGFCQAGTPPNCNDGVSCTTDACNETTDACDHAANNAACDNGLFCDGAETCNVTLGCQAGTAPNCNDSVACTTDSCNEGTDSCNNIPNNAACDDGLFCNGAETCNATLGCQAGTDPCGGDPCDEAGDSCLGVEAWMSFISATTVPGLGTVQDEDIVSYNMTTGTWSMIFDGSDVGLGGFVIDGMAVTSAGDILLSFTVAGNVTGMTGGPGGSTTLDDSDIVRFIPTTLGATTAGSFVFYFDGSDVGLTANDEDIDAIALTSDGRLIVSVLGNFSGTGASGLDEDLFVFNHTSLGATTAGSFAFHFDGSDVGLAESANEDVDAAGMTLAGTLLLSTEGAFSVTGVTGNDEDVIEFTPTSLGATTSGTYTMLLDLSTIGIDPAADVGSIELIE